MTTIDGVALTDEMISEIRDAQSDLTFWAPEVCDKIIDFLIYADGKSAQERIDLIRCIRLIQDFITAFKLDQKGGQS